MKQQQGQWGAGGGGRGFPPTADSEHPVAVEQLEVVLWMEPGKRVRKKKSNSRQVTSLGVFHTFLSFIS